MASAAISITLNYCELAALCPPPGLILGAQGERPGNRYLVPHHLLLPLLNTQ